MTAVAISPTGQIVSAGYAVSPNHTVTYFIGLSQTDGSKSRFFSTGSYLSSALTVATNGSVWTIGSRPGNNYTTNSFGALRNYSHDGTLLYQSLPTRGNGNISSNVTGNAPQIVLAESDPYVFVFNAINKAIYRFSNKASDSQMWKSVGSNMDGRYITDFAVTSDFQVYVSFDTPHPSGSGLLRYSGGLFKLSKQADRTTIWQPIEGTVSWKTNVSDFQRLLGADGMNLVYARMPDQAGNTTIEWAHR